VVLCPPMGLEAVYSHWTLRELAERLAAVGLVALRFDYDGTGDSCGNWDDPDRVASWLANVKSAIEYARDLGVGRVAVVGLRVGGTFAASTLAAYEGIADDLVLWDPCASGRAFLREQKALWAFLRNQAVEWGILDEDANWGLSTATKIEDGAVETPGLVFGKDTVADLEGVSVAATQGALASRVLLLTRDTRKPERRMAERLALSHVETSEVGGQEDLLAVTAITPVETVDRIVEWLCEPQGPRVPVTAPGVTSAVVVRSEDGHTVAERPVIMGAAQLFGMVTEPQCVASSPAPTIMFLNTGRINHVGPGRLWVEMARRLSSSGFRCIRFDLAGIGDSPTRPGRTDQVQYPADAVLDVGEMRAAIAEHDVGDVVLIGVCSGGYHAIESALEQPVKAVCAVNPILTFIAPGQSSDRNFEPLEPGGFNDRQSRSSTRRWTRSITQMKILWKVVPHLPEDMWWIVNRLVVKAVPARTLERVTGLGVNVLIVAGSVEAHDLRRGEHRTIRSLTESGRFRMDTVPHLEHSLLERTGREHVANVFSAYVIERFGARTEEVLPAASLPDG
jgi:alpha-beta hydrolase superfamily lysophospholipase